jgi:hypothetical protein
MNLGNYHGLPLSTLRVVEESENDAASLLKDVDLEVKLNLTTCLSVYLFNSSSSYIEVASPWTSYLVADRINETHRQTLSLVANGELCLVLLRCVEAVPLWLWMNQPVGFRNLGLVIILL